MAILNAVVSLSVAANRPICASTAYPFLPDVHTGTTPNDYFMKIQKPGYWELIFLAGAFLAGLINSLIRKDFKIVF